MSQTLEIIKSFRRLTVPSISNLSESVAESYKMMEEMIKEARSQKQTTMVRLSGAERYSTRMPIRASRVITCMNSLLNE
jgi:N-glycosylase/DNA lyase